MLVKKWFPCIAVLDLSTSLIASKEKRIEIQNKGSDTLVNVAQA